MSFIQQFFTSRDNNANAETFVGQQGRLWWDPVTNKIYASDGVTPGGIPVGGGGGGNGEPGGGNTMVQFNNSGSFGGSSNFTYNNSTGVLTIAGNVSAGNFIGNGSQLTNLPATYSNANVSAYLPTYTGNLVALTGNVTTTANISGNYILGNGSQLTGLPATYSDSNVTTLLANFGSNTILTTGNITAGNFIGTVANAGYADNAAHATVADSANSVSGANVSGSVEQSNYANTANSVSGSNVTGNVGNAVHAYFSDVANSVSGSNVSGQVANALVSGTVYSSAQPNITSVGNLTSVTSTGNIVTTGNIVGAYLYGDGSNITGLPGGLYGNADVSNYLASGTDTANIITTGNISGNYFIGNGSQLTGIVSSYGNANVVANLAALGSNPISTTGNVTAGYFIGNGSALTSLTGANVTGTVANATYATDSAHATVADSANSVSGGNVSGQVANALVAGTVYVGAQPNITSVGTLSTLSVTGNITSSANISGSYILGNGSQLTGLPAAYNDSNVTALLASYGSNTISTTGNITAGNIIANGQALTNLPGANVTGTVANATYATSAGSATTATSATTAGTVTTAAQPNITSVGTLSSLSVTGNVSGNYFIGNGSLLTGIATSTYSNADVSAYLASGTDTANIITTGNVSGGNILGNLFGTNATLTANTTSGNVFANNVQIGGPGGSGLAWDPAFKVLTFPTDSSYAPAMVATTGTFTQYVNAIWSPSLIGYKFISNGMATAYTQNIGSGSHTWTVYQSGVSGSNLGTVSSNSLSYSYGNLWSQGNITATGNVQGTYILGNGSALTSITGANVTGTVANATYATSAGSATTAGTVTTAAQPNITSVGTLSTLSVTGNITGGNLLTSGIISATGNATVGNINATIGTFTTFTSAQGGQVTGTLVATSANAQFFNQTNPVGYTTIAGYLSVTGNITGSGNIIGNGYRLTDINASNIIGTVANATYAVSAGSATTAGTVTTNAQPNITSVGTLTSVTSTGNVTGGNLVTTGNVAGPSSYNQPKFIQPNASDPNWAYGIYTDGASAFWMQSQFFGLNQPTRGFRVLEAEGNTVVFSVNGAGLVSAPGNIQGGNLLTSGLILATGNITSGNLITGGLISATGNITGGNIASNGRLDVAGNITSGNISIGGNFSTPGNIGASYINGAYYTGAWGTNFVALGNISTVANVSGGNVISTGLVSATGNITGNRITVGAGSATAPSVQFSDDISADTGLYWVSDGNIGVTTNGVLRATFLDTGLSVVGNVTGGNIISNSAVYANAVTAFVAGDAAISGVALQMPNEGAIRNLTNGFNNMYFDVSIGGSTNGQFNFRSGSSYTSVLVMSPTAVSFNTDATVTSRTPSLARTAFNSAIDTEITVDSMRFRISNQGGIFPQVIGNGSSRNLAWTGVGAISGSAVAQAGSTGTIVASNAWTTLYNLHGMDSAGDTVTVTLQDKAAGRIYRITFMRSDNGSTTGYNIIAERLL